MHMFPLAMSFSYCTVPWQNPDTLIKTCMHCTFEEFEFLLSLYVAITTLRTWYVWATPQTGLRSSHSDTL